MRDYYKSLKTIQRFLKYRDRRFKQPGKKSPRSSVFISTQAKDIIEEGRYMLASTHNMDKVPNAREFVELAVEYFCHKEIPNWRHDHNIETIEWIEM